MARTTSSAAILPSLIFYGACGLIGEEFETYSVRPLNDDGLASFAAPHEVDSGDCLCWSRWSSGCCAVRARSIRARR